MSGEKLHLNTGDWLHLLQIGIMILSLGAAFERFRVMSENVDNHTDQLNRIERYLSSRDPEYWQRTKEVLALPLLK
jgi:hypothetical protein